MRRQARGLAAITVIGLILLLRRSCSDVSKAAAEAGSAKVERGVALEGLDREKLIHRSLEVSPAGYLTIISIIQGATLAVLAQKTYEEVSAHSNMAPLILSQALVILLILAFVFHVYVVITIILRWAPSYLDSVLPFVFGGLELPPAFFLGRISWVVPISLFWLGGSLGLVVTVFWAPQGHFGAALKARRIFRRLLVETVVSACVMTGFSIAFSLLGQRYPHDRSNWGVVAALAMVLGMIWIVTNMERRLCQLYAQYGVPRALFN